jgi:MerR family transcriptional regulator, thiopeptide resistance regulator
MSPMPSTPAKTYRIGEFARLAGVTPRALHHYDRLGLLKPHRSGAGYRVYTDADLERLVQIVALKFVGIPLKKIRRLSAKGPDNLAAVLHAQRQVLEEKRQLLDQAITAIREAERALRVDGQAAPGLYRRIIEVIEMQDNSDWNAKYQQLVDMKVARLKALSPEDLAGLRQEWSVLVEAVRAILTDDPASSRAQALAERWIGLLGRLMGGPVDRKMARSGSAGPTGGQWGPSEADRPVWEFMQRALAQE